MNQNQFTEQEWHKKQAIDLSNETWDLIDNSDRTDEETFLMIHTAHALRYHWTKVGDFLEISKAEWLVSRVYSLLGMGDQALLHAQYSLDICQDNHIKDLALAMAFEAITRAAYLLEDEELYEGYYRMTSDAAKEIARPEDKSYCLTELKSIKSAK